MVEPPETSMRMSSEDLEKDILVDLEGLLVRKMEGNWK